MPLVSSHRERVVALVVVAVLAGVCWAVLGKMVWDMNAWAVDGMGVPMSRGLGYIAWLILMWAVMMAAMMLPSAVPMTLAFADFTGAEDHGGVSPVLAFIAGYVAAWSAFSVIAALGQRGLDATVFYAPALMALKRGPVAGAVLIAAGAYQWTPLKHACLKKCRTPFGFLMTEWRDGPGGALVMGWRHGLFCVGCCWALMGLLFVAGVMNGLWIILLMVLVAVEKLAPHGALVGRVFGVGLVGAGLWLTLA